MNWDFLDILDLISNFLNIFSSSSSSDVSITTEKKKIKYVVEKVSASFLLISGMFLFFIFKDPLPVQNDVLTCVVTSCIGLAISLLFFFVLNIFELYYFKSLFQLLLFSCSAILFFISIIFCIYFKSGIFL